MIDIILQSVEEGTLSPLVAYAKLKDIEKQLKGAFASVQQDAVEDAEKYGSKNFKAHGYKFELRNGPRRWDFKGVPEWATAKEGLAQIEAKSKAAYASYEQGLMSATSDGEEVTLPKVTFAASSIVVNKEA